MNMLFALNLGLPKKLGLIIFVFMDDIKVFLRWYLNPRTRLKRGMFNVIFFLAFVPVLYIKFMGITEASQQKTSQYAPVLNVLKQSLHGDDQLDLSDVQGVDRSDRTRQAASDLMDALDFQNFQHSSSITSKNFNLGDLLNVIIYLLLIPVVMMRLRDLGKRGDETYLYTGLVYSGIAFDTFKSLFGFDVPFMLDTVSGVLSFVLLSWLCMSDSKLCKSTAGKKDTYMPGDGPNDPY